MSIRFLFAAPSSITIRKQATWRRSEDSSLRNIGSMASFRAISVKNQYSCWFLIWIAIMPRHWSSLPVSTVVSTVHWIGINKSAPIWHRLRYSDLYTCHSKVAFNGTACWCWGGTSPEGWGSVVAEERQDGQRRVSHHGNFSVVLQLNSFHIYEYILA